MVRSTRRAVPAIGVRHLFLNCYAVTVYLGWFLGQDHVLRLELPDYEIFLEFDSGFHDPPGSHCRCI